MISHAVDHTGYSSSSDLQHKLFDGDVAIDPVPQQQSVREPSSIDARRELIMRVFGEADSHFISSYVKCLVEFGLTLRTLSPARSAGFMRSVTANCRA